MEFLARLAIGYGSGLAPTSDDWQQWLPSTFAIAHYFAFTSMMPDDAGCSAVAGCPDMGWCWASVVSCFSC